MIGLTAAVFLKVWELKYSKFGFPSQERICLIIIKMENWNASLQFIKKMWYYSSGKTLVSVFLSAVSENLKKILSFP